MAYGRIPSRAPELRSKDRQRDIDGIWQHDMFEITENQIQYENSQRENFRPAELHVSNLNHDVSERDLSDLFSSIGRVRKVCLNHDTSGRSLGTAEIFFERKVDAMEAIDKFNGCPLDNEIIELSIKPSIKKIPFQQRQEIQRYQIPHRRATTQHHIDFLTVCFNEMNLK